MGKDKIEITKRCTTCNTEKPESEFYKNKNGSMGLDCYCRTCRIKRNKRWVRKNRKLSNEIVYAWRKKNRKTVNALNRAWYHNNLEHCREYLRNRPKKDKK